MPSEALLPWRGHWPQGVAAFWNLTRGTRIKAPGLLWTMVIPHEPNGITPYIAPSTEVL